MKRNGPKPLPLHLGLAAASCTQLQGGAHDPDFCADETFRDLLAGIKKYQLHPYERTLEPLPVVWEKGQVRLFAAQAATKAKGRRPLVVIPSMINASSILDLMEGRSFVRWMAAHQDRDVLLLDWGNSIEDAGQQSLDDLVMRRLNPALDYVVAEYGGPVHALGYCMGGVLLLAAALSGQKQADRFTSLGFLATPWDFHAGDRSLQRRVVLSAPAGQAYIAQKGYLPASWVQSVFASLDPFLSARKFSAFAALDDADEKARRFVAVEDWLNDSVDLPGAVAQSCMQDWFECNRTGQGQWYVCGQRIVPEDVEGPGIVVTAAKDRLVTPESSRALAEKLEDARLIECDTGHIGLLAGDRAPDMVWTPIADALHEYD